MSSDEISLVSPQNGLTSHQLGNVFQEDALRFGCGPPPQHHQHQQQRRVGGDPAKTRELPAYNIDEKLFSTTPTPTAATTSSSFPAHQTPHDFPRNIYHRASDHPRDPHGTSGDESDPEEDEEDDEDEDDDEVDDDDVDSGDVGVGGGGRHHLNHQAEALVAAVDNNNNNNNNSNKNNKNTNTNTNTTTTSNTNNVTNSGNVDKLGNGKSKHHSSFGKYKSSQVTIFTFLSSSLKFPLWIFDGFICFLGLLRVWWGSDGGERWGWWYGASGE